MKPNSVLLASGGMDSTTLAYWLDSQNITFYPLFLDYGQHCAKTEFDTLLDVLPKKYVEQIKALSIADLYQGSKSRLIVEADLWNEEVDYKDFYLPYRNLLFLSIGSAFAQSQGCAHLYAAFINSNHAKEIDCSAEFFDKLTTLLADFGTVQVKMPFRTLSKYEVAKIGIALKAPIGATFSCQASSKIPCGACPNCVDRLEALSQLG